MAGAFIPSSAFDGDDNHRPQAAVKFGRGRAVFNGQIVFATISRKEAETLLPSEVKLALANNHGSQPAMHPVIHLHGMQTQTSWVIDGQPRPVGTAYGEYMLLLPFVQIDQSTQWFNFVVRMYLEDIGAVTLGLDFGYRKRLGQVSIAPQSCRVATANLFNIFQWQEAFASTHKADASLGAMQLPNWPEMQAILSMPLLGVNEGTAIRLCSYFLLDFADAEVEPINCTSDYTSAFEPPVPVPTMTNCEDGAVTVTGLAWQIDFPAILC